MKDKDHRTSKLKHQLYQLRRARKKNPRWKLSQETVELIERWGYPVEPCLYCIHTRSIPNVKSQCGLLKKIHYGCVKDRKRVIFQTLNQGERKLLNEHGVCFEPYKYEIILQRYSGK